MSAVEEYRKLVVNDDDGMKLQGDPWETIAWADAAIDELEATIERLKCCGNCGHWSDFNLCSVGGHDDFMGNDACHFTPSRWTPREAS